MPCVSLSLSTCVHVFGHRGRLFCCDLEGNIFGTRASGTHGIEKQSSLHGCTHPQVHPQPNARHHARTLRGECGFFAAWLLVQAIEAMVWKSYVLGRKPSRKLSAVFPPFPLGKRLPFFLGCKFGCGVEGCLFVWISDGNARIHKFSPYAVIAHYPHSTHTTRRWHFLSFL